MKGGVRGRPPWGAVVALVGRGCLCRGASCRLRCSCYQMGEGVGCCRLFARSFHLVSASARVIAPLYSLHRLCISEQLLRSYGDPPLDRGMSSSTTALISCGYFSALSTRLPQSLQCVSSFRTRARNCLRLCPLPPSARLGSLTGCPSLGCPWGWVRLVPGLPLPTGWVCL